MKKNFAYIAGIGHPEVERVRIRYAVSLEKNLIAVSYDHHDLLATYDLQGNLFMVLIGTMLQVML